MENVVQVVSDNASNYKKAREMLMEKRKGLFWTPCAAHCLDLILKDFEKKIKYQQKKQLQMEERLLHTYTVMQGTYENEKEGEVHGSSGFCIDEPCIDESECAFKDVDDFPMDDVGASNNFNENVEEECHFEENIELSNKELWFG
ncbi:hypothetical protein Acr_03g0015380 [Actinidia rufa]|uniref:DUF659 domain-containing protein n=1 Tax=Actinidia rufa TaxID=165716 RepID=A0A7J0EE46_9ERIC|nr:hypothetical protein Acr_03g0015380 [Actinidia rufa]